MAVPLEGLPRRVREVVAWRRAQGPLPLGGGAMTYGAMPNSDHLPPCARGLKLQDILAKDDEEGEDEGGQGGQEEKRRRPFRLSGLPAEEVSNARLVLGMLFLAAGGLDEAHAVAQIALSKEFHYVHALLHRQEGAAHGELGLTGWANSRYWFGVLERRNRW